MNGLEYALDDKVSMFGHAVEPKDGNKVPYVTCWSNHIFVSKVSVEHTASLVEICIVIWSPYHVDLENGG
jgi:hypothetical protein